MSLIKNPLQMTFLMLLWGMLFTLILYLLTEEGITLNFGPSEDRFFLSIQINTWSKWFFIGGLIMIDKIINSISVDIIGSWISHTLQDHKTHYLPYKKNICHFISNVYSLYFNLRYILTLKLYTSQIDYAILRSLSDVIATHYTISMQIMDKVHINNRED